MSRLPVSVMTISTPGWRWWKVARVRSTTGAAWPVLPIIPSRSRPEITPANSASSASAVASSASTARARGEQDLARAGEADRATGPFQQGDALFPLQAADLVAQRGLHDMAAGRCPGEAQLLGEGDEVLQLTGIHQDPRLISFYYYLPLTYMRNSPPTRRLTLLLGGFTAFGPLSMDLYLPAFPELAADLGASQAAVQLTLTADVVGLVVGQLVLGPLSDARGRRGLLIGSTLICAIASVLCALAPSAALLSVWRFVQGASGGGGIVLARAIAADVAQGVAAARLFSLFMTVSSVAPSVAPVLGGVLLAATGSWRPMFWLLAAISVVLAAATWLMMPETLPEERRHAGGLQQTGRAFAALAQFSLAFAVNAAGMIALGLANAWLVQRFPVRRLLLVGLGASTVAAGVLLAAVLSGLDLIAVLVPLFVVVATRGLVSSNATVLGVQHASVAGSASAILGALMFTGGILVTPLLALGGEGPSSRWWRLSRAGRWRRCWRPRCSPGSGSSRHREKGSGRRSPACSVQRSDAGRPQWRIGSASAARDAGARKVSAKYCVSCTTCPSANSMMLTE